MEILKRLVTEEEGAGIVEYGLLIALIALVAVASFEFLTDGIAALFTDIGDKLDPTTTPPAGT